MDLDKFAGSLSKKPKKEAVEQAQLLMALSKRDLAEAKRLRKEAAKADPAKRQEILEKVLDAARTSKKFAEEAERLVASR